MLLQHTTGLQPKPMSQINLPPEITQWYERLYSSFDYFCRTHFDDSDIREVKNEDLFAVPDTELPILIAEGLQEGERLFTPEGELELRRDQTTSLTPLFKAHVKPMTISVTAVSKDWGREQLETMDVIMDGLLSLKDIIKSSDFLFRFLLTPKLYVTPHVYPYATRQPGTITLSGTEINLITRFYAVSEKVYFPEKEEDTKSE